MTVHPPPFALLDTSAYLTRRLAPTSPSLVSGESAPHPGPLSVLCDWPATWSWRAQGLPKKADQAV
jgi:hypothetical protein